MTNSGDDSDAAGRASLALAAAPITQAVFIDARTPDIADLIAGALPGEAIFVLDPDQDGLDQIAADLSASGLSGLSSLSIVAHGASGQMLLGSTIVDETDLTAHAAALAQIGSALAPNGDLSLYGCDVGQGAAGREFIQDLSSFVGGADVAAATHLVGSTDLGGSFALDAATGAPVSAAPFTAAALASYEGVLATPQSTAVAGDPDVFILSDAGGSDNALQSISDTGTYPESSATTYFSAGTNEPSALNNNVGRILLDPQNNDYFIDVANSGVNKIVEGSLSGLSTAATETLTTIYSDNAPN